MTTEQKKVAFVNVEGNFAVSFETREKEIIDVTHMGKNFQLACAAKPQVWTGMMVNVVAEGKGKNKKLKLVG